MYRSSWLDKKNITTISPINKTDGKCFQYAGTFALNYEEIGKYAERITKIKPFTNKYDQERINYPSEKDDWKNIEKNNVALALSVLYAKKQQQQQIPAYVLKHNSNHEIQINISMISNGEKQRHYIAIKRLSTLLTGKSSKIHDDFYYLNFFHSFVT